MRGSPRRPRSSARYRPHRRVSSSRRSRSRSHRSTFRSCTAGRRVRRPRRSGLSRESDRHPAQSIEPACARSVWFGSRRSGKLFAHDLVAEGDALVADEDAVLTRDEPPDLVLALTAEGASDLVHRYLLVPGAVIVLTKIKTWLRRLKGASGSAPTIS